MNLHPDYGHPISRRAEILKAAKIAPIKDVAREYNVSQQTIYRWRKLEEEKQ